MADTKISGLADIVTIAAGDQIAVADASDLTVSKRATMTEINAYLQTLPLAGAQITTLSDLGTVSNTNTFAVVDSGTAKEVPMSAVRSFCRPTVITGATGTVDQSDIGAITIHVLTSNPSDVTGTGLVTQMTASTMGLGWWRAEYFVHWQSDVTTTGINMRVDHTGTATPFMAYRIDPVSSTTALATVGIAHQTTDEGVTGNLPSTWAANADAGDLGPNAGVTTADSTEFSRVTALFLVTGSGNLTFQIAAEIAATNVRLMAGTHAYYTRLT